MGFVEARVPPFSFFAMCLENLVTRDNKSSFIQEPVQVNHSELPASRNLYRRADSMNALMWELEEVVAEIKTPEHDSLI
jgi:hypothetical protein